MTEPTRVQAAAYRPPDGGGGPPRSRRPRLWLLATGAGLAVLALGAWFVFTALAVAIDVRPAPDRLAIEGGWSIPVGERHLLRPGEYRVVAEKTGYRVLTETFTVARDGDDSFRFEMRKKPGRLQLATEPAETTVLIDGEAVGQTPLEPIELEPGEHRLTFRAPRHESAEQTVLIEGMDKLQTLNVTLTPAWAPVAIDSVPAGAILSVDGEERGPTPQTVELGAGEHELQLTQAGYQTWTRRIEVVADEPQSLGPIELAPAPGRLDVSSRPAGASVTVAGEFRGRTPVEVALAPDTDVSVRVARAGHQSVTREFRLAAGQRESLAVDLEPVLGTIQVAVSPEDAVVHVDGEARGPGSRELRLTAVAHDIRVTRPGYAPFETEVTPKPGETQRIEAKLLTEEAATLAEFSDTERTPAGGTMRLMPTGQFTMGAPRREQGARSNEVRREVKLTRPFYIGVHEVSNERFRRFRSGHSSGIVARKTLDNDDQPVARVSWEDAVAYCNWLSDQAGLPRTYSGGELITPVTTGYRLPTEAEWAWAARFAGGRSLKYPWGDAMPPTGRAGNYADASAADLLDERLQDYDDGYAAAAPIGRFAANALGLFDLGGNVAEWIHDRYSANPGSGGVEADPLGPSSGSARVVRGSSWRHGRITPLRLSYREAGSSPRDDLGFRVARYAE